MIHKCRFTARACVHTCTLLPYPVWTDRTKGEHGLKTDARAKGDGAYRGFLLATPPGIDEKGSADLPQLELDYQPTPTTLVNRCRLRVGRVKEDIWEIQLDDNRARVRSIRETQLEEDVRRNFEERTRRTQKQLDLLLKRGMHMHGRGHSTSLVFCLFSSSRCLFIVLAHKKDRRPVAKINRVKMWRELGGQKNRLCKRECSVRLGWIVHR